MLTTWTLCSHIEFELSTNTSMDLYNFYIWSLNEIYIIMLE